VIKKIATISNLDKTLIGLPGLHKIQVINNNR